MTAASSSVPVALAIAGFDPSSGAGITADLKTFAAHGVYGVACITAMTVQSTMGVQAVAPAEATWVGQTLSCLAEDVALSGIKIGMLGASPVAAQVASFLLAQAGEVPLFRIILDPVLRSTSGTPLLDPDGVRILRENLIGRVGWITPNIEELAILAGENPLSVGREQLPAMATRLKEMAARAGNQDLNVLVTGGHLSSPDDLLCTAAGEQIWLTGERIETPATHGTGCAFSSALLCAVIGGLGGHHAARAAKDYVTGALRSAYPIGRGKGPMNHLYRLRPV